MPIAFSFNHKLILDSYILHRESSGKEILDDTKWIDDFQSQQQADDELAKTANEFLSSVDDPQLTNSEVM